MNTDYDKLVPLVSKLLGRYGIEAGFVLPTDTAMGKAIMDATWPLREYLHRKKFHDYRAQAKGTDAKRVCPVWLIQPGGLVEAKVSMYRPKTKDGDPRIWIYGLPQYASSGDLIALIVEDGKLYAVNCRRIDLAAQLADSSSFLGQLATRLDTHAAAATELLAKLRMVAADGFVPSLRDGDTGIGFTLETPLGIAAKSSKTPDFHGIELKSGRLGKRKRTASSQRVTLFSSIPQWDKSSYSARKALETFGYHDPETGRLQLYCSVDAKQPNSLGFRLEARPDLDHIVNVNSSHGFSGEDVFLWLLDALRRSFAAKHRETFWVSAHSKRVNGREHFHFVQARHTRNPPLSTFERLLATGGICVDLTMSEKGTSLVRDHGYLFRVYGNCFDELFPEVATHSLV